MSYTIDFTYVLYDIYHMCFILYISPLKLPVKCINGCIHMLWYRIIKQQITASSSSSSTTTTSSSLLLLTTTITISSSTTTSSSLSYHHHHHHHRDENYMLKIRCPLILIVSKIYSCWQMWCIRCLFPFPVFCVHVKCLARENFTFHVHVLHLLDRDFISNRIYPFQIV